MAVIDDVAFRIDRSSFPEGSICTLHYRYNLICDPAEIRTGMGYSVWCELWGKDVFIDDVLGDVIYDPHTLVSSEINQIARHFNVPCEVLDEDLGKDEIFLKVSATNTLGHTLSANSAIIRDRF